MKIYLAGPMRGIKDFNFAAFDSAARTLRDCGFIVFNPADGDRDAHPADVFVSATGDDAEAAAKGFSLRDALAADTQWIAKHADAIALLPGWENSKGARAEHALACALDLEIYALHRDGTRWATERLIPSPLVDPPPLRLAFGNDDGSIETREVSSSGGEKGSKLARFDLIPGDALWQLAELFGRGAAKYEARNWERGYAWSLSFAALQRHAWAFWNGEDVDPEMGVPHSVCAAWHALALTRFITQHPDFDDRPHTQPSRTPAPGQQEEVPPSVQL